MDVSKTFAEGSKVAISTAAMSRPSAAENHPAAGV
jgi:hypothetical protein